MAAGGCRRVTASMMKFKPNQTRTYDREGYKKRAACLCFRSEREDEVSPARGAGGREPRLGQSGAAGAGWGSAALCLGVGGTATRGRPRAGGGGGGVGAGRVRLSPTILGLRGAGPRARGGGASFVRAGPRAAPRVMAARCGTGSRAAGMASDGGARRGARPSPGGGKLNAVPPRGRLLWVLIVVSRSSEAAR